MKDEEMDAFKVEVHDDLEGTILSLEFSEIEDLGWLLGVFRSKSSGVRNGVDPALGVLGRALWAFGDSSCLKVSTLMHPF